jgi:CubicO group peptidase (beta-lactamase class C family)
MPVSLNRRRFSQFLLGGAVVAGHGRALAGGEGADGLLRARPETCGVSSEAILDFLHEVAAAEQELHSFMLWRHGNVVAEGWWWPYRPALPHMMHSLTKSVTASGVGLALAEGRFRLDDRVVSFFPDHLPAQVDDHLAAMTVEDLLTMRTGHAAMTSGSVWRPLKTSWITEFFKIPVVHRPGTKFVYTSAASYMLSAIVTRTTGETLKDYLRPRFFAPLGIGDVDWETAMQDGVTPGANGLTWRTADALKLGIVHAQGGRWNGRQLLPADWVSQVGARHGSDGEYGYQWWLGPDSAYYADGLFGQYSIVFPAHDAVLAITSASRYRVLMPLVWKYFPAAFAAARGAPRDVGAVTGKLRLLPKLQPTASPLAQQISGAWFVAAPNEDGVRRLRFDFERDRCLFTLEDERGEHHVTAGTHDWIEGHTSMTGNKLHHEYQLDRMRVVAGGAWRDPSCFEMTWQFVESAFRDRVTCRFDGKGGVTLARSVNVNSGAKERPLLTARRV